MSRTVGSIARNAVRVGHSRLTPCLVVRREERTGIRRAILRQDLMYVRFAWHPSLRQTVQQGARKRPRDKLGGFRTESWLDDHHRTIISAAAVNKPWRVPASNGVR